MFDLKGTIHRKKKKKKNIQSSSTQFHADGKPKQLKFMGKNKNKKKTSPVLSIKMYFKSISWDLFHRYCTKETEEMNHSAGRGSHLILWHGKEYSCGFSSPQTTGLPLTTTTFQRQFCMSLSAFMQSLNFTIHTCSCSLLCAHIRASRLHRAIRCHALSSPLWWMQMRGEISQCGNIRRDRYPCHHAS